MPVAPSSAFGLGSGSGLGSSSSSVATTSAPALPPTSAPAPPPTSAPALPPPTTGAAMPVTPPTSLQQSQHAACQQEHDSHIMGSPENCHTPAAPNLPRPPTLNGWEYHHLPANLATMLAHLPPMPVPQRRSHHHNAAATSSMPPPPPPLLQPFSIGPTPAPPTHHVSAPAVAFALGPLLPSVSKRKKKAKGQSYDT
ncbi:hypothetical protein EDB85DRAFT_1901807 [Lactarius pseudohatsudake]|nr:hypothetical protein EDB85DRAFT_1901807 [Lactarius pseudohatsudake]